jgi:catechol 2,3-dioxygenase-like lactoylglutathione lyase family enzyme
VFVLNQDEALQLYTEKLGFEVRDDIRVGDYRWLAVGPKGQPDLDFVLSEIKPGGQLDEEGVAHIRALLAKGGYGAGVFATSDCRATYEELKGRGVEFLSPPEEQPYGIEAMFKDNSGNWFSLTQHR